MKKKNKWWSSKPSYTHQELKVLAIVKKWLANNDTTLIISDLEHCIINKEKTIHIFIGYDKISIVNHKFSIIENVATKLGEGLMKLTKQTQADRIKEIKKTVLSNKSDILTEIFNKE